MSEGPGFEPESTTVAMTISGADLERLLMVAGDLEYLRSLPVDRLLSHTEVRIAAGILRRLLVDGQLNAVWRPVGQATRAKLTVDSVEIDTALSSFPERWIQLAWAGGASTDVAHHTGVVMANIPEADHSAYGSMEELLAANPMPVNGQKRRMILGDWLKATSVAIRTNEIGLVKISRRSVLKYIANRKGGVHFDPRRDLSLKETRKQRELIEYYLLDHGLLRVGHLSGPEYEVASMVQAVASAPWAGDLIESAQRAAPEDWSGDPLELKFWTGLREADGTGWATSRMQPGPDRAVAADSPSEKPDVV